MCDKHGRAITCVLCRDLSLHITEIKHRVTANGKREFVYHLTKFSIFLSFTVHYIYTKIGRFTPILSTKIVLSCLYLLIPLFEFFSACISRLPFQCRKRDA